MDEVTLYDIEEDNDYSLDYFMDWMCWMQATNGERFYPPKQTAQECVDALEPDALADELADNWRDTALAWEEGQHGRAWSDATEFFIDMQRWGFKPVARTERYIDRTHVEDDGEYSLSDMTWDWLKATRFDFPEEYDDSE